MTRVETPKTMFDSDMKAQRVRMPSPIDLAPKLWRGTLHESFSNDSDFEGNIRVLRTKDVRREHWISEDMASTQVNGLSSHLARWAERLKNLTVSPLTRDFPESQDGDRATQATETRESLDAS